MREIVRFRQKTVGVMLALLALLFLAAAFVAALVFTSHAGFLACAAVGCSVGTVLGAVLLTWLAMLPLAAVIGAFGYLGIERIAKRVADMHATGALADLTDGPESLSKVVKQLSQDLAQERQARLEADARAEYALAHDALTGLVNRTRAHDLITQSIARGRKDATGLALYFLDFDDFKYINDTYGHIAGDQFLRLMGDRLRRALDCDDCVARVGGDEFLIMSEGITDESHAASIAQALLTEVAKPCVINGHDVKVTTSIGVGLFPIDAQDAQSLMNCADRAMYHAKQDGRNAFRFYKTRRDARGASLRGRVGRRRGGSGRAAGAGADAPPRVPAGTYNPSHVVITAYTEQMDRISADQRRSHGCHAVYFQPRHEPRARHLCAAACGVWHRGSCRSGASDRRNDRHGEFTRSRSAHRGRRSAGDKRCAANHGRCHTDARRCRRGCQRPGEGADQRGAVPRPAHARVGLDTE